MPRKMGAWLAETLRRQETFMRALLNVRFPHKEFNALVKDGSAGAKMEQILAELKPEAVYFTEQGGRRSALVIVDLADASKIPSLAEPFFLTFGADVELRPVMTPEDLKKGGLGALGKKWG
jgi:hypothetical protein